MGQDDNHWCELGFAEPAVVYVKAMSNVGCIIEGPDLYNYMSGKDNLEMLAGMNKNITKDDIIKSINLVGM